MSNVQKLNKDLYDKYDNRYVTKEENGLILEDTLALGQTSLVFSNENITTESTLDFVYTSIFGVSIKSALFEDGTLTLEFPVQTEDVDVKVVIK